MPNWEKIKRLSFQELYVRVGQKWSAFGERHSLLSLGRLPTEQQLLSSFVNRERARPFSSVAEILDYFRSRPLKFFASFADRNRTTEILLGRFAGSNPALIAKADDCLKGSFDLLGLKGLQFGTPPNWSLEPVLGKQTPLVHWSKLDYLDAAVSGDKKIVWELNRHQYFMTLGRAYWGTGEEAYARTFAEHLESWMEQNPPKLGINWASSLEVGFRSISWLWSFHFFKDSPALTPQLFGKALRYLYVHGRHLETYLSTFFSPNTHLTGEALSLYYLGSVFPEFVDAARWRSLGWQILIDQLPIHVQSDGVYFEQSSYYHRYTTDFYSHCFLLAQLNGDSVPQVLQTSLAKLLDHLMYITRPDGTSPLFGDDDGGRLAMLAENASNDFRAALSTGAVLLDRSDLKFVARDISEETLWLLGPTGVKRFDDLESEPPATQSKAFESGGYYVMRDGWTSKSNYLLFDCGRHGAANCGHAHADALAFELAARGETLLVDSGTYTYTGSKELRDWFRSSAAHNTLMIDGRSSSSPAGPFSWKTKANCRTLEWISHSRFDFVSGTHDGYSQLNNPGSHVRSILFLKNDYWLIRDEVTVSDQADVDLRYHFDYDVDAAIEKGLGGSDSRVVARRKGRLQIAVFGANGEWKREESWVSHCYAQKEPAPSFTFSVKLTSGTSTLLTLLLPADEMPIVMREMKANGGLAVELSGPDWTDILMIRTGSRVETGTLASDFDLSWARFLTGSVGIPDELVALGGKTFEVQGKDVLRLTNKVGHAYAKADGDGFHIESDVNP